MTKRRYQLKKRAEGQQETRHRIVAAAASLHRDIGPAATTITSVAERAGVQRLTVYRHFPDEGDLMLASAQHFHQHHPLPDPRVWSGHDDPTERLVAALSTLYAYYRAGAATLEHAHRDATRVAALAEAMTVPMERYLAGVVGLLAHPWKGSPGDGRRLHTALVHAVTFDTWRAFDARGLQDAETIELMERFVTAVAGSAGDPY
jgi:AcrR family transcriptional regulator